MKIDIIVVYKNRYKKGHEYNFVPPVTGVHLAALTPSHHEIRLIHQQVQKVDINSDADVVALSFFTGFASEAYSLALQFKKKNKVVIAGGPHVTYCQEEALDYFDAIMAGESEAIWGQVLEDIENNRLKRIYIGEPLENFDTEISPRYDLLPNKYFIKKVIQATRGCPYNCTFCSVPTLNPGFRKRPIETVLRDICYDNFTHWWQRKVVWFWDDNLTIDRKYIKELLTRMIPLKKWWLTQASMDIANDDELLDLMKKSGCIGVFFGIETFGMESLLDANKLQNEVNNYKKAIKKIHGKGISVMAGFITGFDHDTPESFSRFVDILYEIGVDVPFISVLTPYKGTKLYHTLQFDHRILKSKGWDYYNGYNVTFMPKNMSPEELLEHHRTIWMKAFSLKHSIRRIIRSLFTLSTGAALLSLFMNGFYCLKRIRSNMPINMEEEHVSKVEIPVR
ncbi:MAG: B12-binding domain-containing radical SAM protein [Bacillota bacterium]